MISIHCGWHPHCRLNRTLKEGRNPNQGKCVGFMQAWEEAGGDPGIRKQNDHIKLSYAPHRARFTYDIRSAARRRVKAESTLHGVLAKERGGRPLAEGELSDPEGFC